MKIVIILPTYNEKTNIERMIPMLEKEVIPTVKDHTLEILVADDKSPDGTAEVVRGFMKKHKNITLLEGEKNGLGAAYAKAMTYAMEKIGAGAVIEFDSDFQHDPHDIPRLIAAMDKGFDYVIGSRYIPGGKIPKEWGLHRKMMSFFGSLFARVVLMCPNIHDMTSGFKLTKTDYLKKIDLNHLYSKYYAYKIQILYEIVKLKAKVTEVPIVFYERTEGSSKIERRDLFDSFIVVMKLRIRDSARFIKFLVTGGTGFATQIIIQEGSIYIGLAAVMAAFLLPLEQSLLGVNDLEGLSHTVGAALGAEAAILSNFLINNFWTFEDTRKLKEKSPFFIRLLKFNGFSLLSISLQTLAVYLGERFIGPEMNLANYTVPTRIAILFPTIIFIVIPLNYLIYNKLIWKTQYLKNKDYEYIEKSKQKKS